MSQNGEPAAYTNTRPGILRAKQPLSLSTLAQRTLRLQRSGKAWYYGKVSALDVLFLFLCQKMNFSIFLTTVDIAVALMRRALTGLFSDLRLFIAYELEDTVVRRLTSQ